MYISPCTALQINGVVFLETTSRQSFHGFLYDDYVGIHLTLQKGQSEEEF